MCLATVLSLSFRFAPPSTKVYIHHWPVLHVMLIESPYKWVIYSEESDITMLFSMSGTSHLFFAHICWTLSHESPIHGSVEFPNISQPGKHSYSATKVPVSWLKENQKPNIIICPHLICHASFPFHLLTVVLTRGWQGKTTKTTPFDLYCLLVIVNTPGNLFNTPFHNFFAEKWTTGYTFYSKQYNLQFTAGQPLFYFS